MASILGMCRMSGSLRTKPLIDSQAIPFSWTPEGSDWGMRRSEKDGRLAQKMTFVVGLEDSMSVWRRTRDHAAATMPLSADVLQALPAKTKQINLALKRNPLQHILAEWAYSGRQWAVRYGKP